MTHEQCTPAITSPALGPSPASWDDTGETGERRTHARYFLTAPAIVIPVLPGGHPDGDRRLDAYTTDISQDGLGFEISPNDELPGKHFVLGVETPSGEVHFAAVEVRHRTPIGDRLRVGVRFCHGASDLLRTENLRPQLVRERLEFATRLPEEVLQSWGMLGVMRPMLDDYVLVCPECRALPTFRNGCRRCSSPRLLTCQLIHHFACAHVGYVTDFDQDGVLICLKCRARNLIVGADFEYLTGPFTCLDCQWSDTELEQVGQCLACGVRFPRWRAAELELIGYHVQRLDPLAFLPAS